MFLDLVFWRWPVGKIRSLLPCEAWGLGSLLPFLGQHICNLSLGGMWLHMGCLWRGAIGCPNSQVGGDGSSIGADLLGCVESKLWSQHCLTSDSVKSCKKCCPGSSSKMDSLFIHPGLMVHPGDNLCFLCGRSEKPLQPHPPQCDLFSHSHCRLAVGHCCQNEASGRSGKADSGATLPGFWVRLPPQHLLAVWPLISHLTSLSLSFLRYKIGLVMLCSNIIISVRLPPSCHSLPLSCFIFFPSSYHRLLFHALGFTFSDDFLFLSPPTGMLILMGWGSVRFVHYCIPGT